MAGNAGNAKRTNTLEKKKILKRAHKNLRNRGQILKWDIYLFSRLSILNHPSPNSIHMYL